jgi:hypothetical protein
VLNFEIASMTVYERAFVFLVFLREWFDFKNSPFNFEQIAACFKLFGVQFDGDKLYEEFASLQEIPTALNEEENRTDLNWLIFLTQCYSLELLKLLKYVLIKPISDVAVEHLFSSFLNDVKAEICSRVNFKKFCSEFAEWVTTQRLILEAASSDKENSFFWIYYQFFLEQLFPRQFFPVSFSRRQFFPG